MQILLDSLWAAMLSVVECDDIYGMTDPVSTDLLDVIYDLSGAIECTEHWLFVVFELRLIGQDVYDTIGDWLVGFHRVGL